MKLGLCYMPRDEPELRCQRTADLEALFRELGADDRVADFVARSGKCGAKWPQHSVRVGPIPTGGMR